MLSARHLAVLFALLLGSLAAAAVIAARDVDGTRLRTEVALEVGGPPPDLELLVDRLADAYVVDGAMVTIRVLDGPNAALAEVVRPPGVAADGRLDTDARSETARRDVVDSLRAEHLAWARAIFEVHDHHEGRDITGLLARISRSEPDHLIVFFTTGGLHRTEDNDWATHDDWIIDVDLAVDTNIELHGVAAVAAPQGVTAKHFTDALTDVWLTFCEPIARCEVVQ